MVGFQRSLCFESAQPPAWLDYRHRFFLSLCFEKPRAEGYWHVRLSRVGSLLYLGQHGCLLPAYLLQVLTRYLACMGGEESSVALLVAPRGWICLRYLLILARKSAAPSRGWDLDALFSLLAVVAREGAADIGQKTDRQTDRQAGSRR